MPARGKTTRIDTADLTCPCFDKWPLGSLRETAMQAYKSLEAKGELIIMQVLLFDKAGSKKRTEIYYMAAFPHDWMREALKSEEQRIIAAGKQERMAI